MRTRFGSLTTSGITVGSAGSSKAPSPCGTNVFSAAVTSTSGASSASCPVQHPPCSSAGSGVWGLDVPSASASGSAACLVGFGSAFNRSSSATAAWVLSVHSRRSSSVNGFSLQLRRYSSYSQVPFCSSKSFKKKPSKGIFVFIY